MPQQIGYLFCGREKHEKWERDWRLLYSKSSWNHMFGYISTEKAVCLQKHQLASRATEWLIFFTAVPCFPGVFCLWFVSLCHSYYESPSGLGSGNVDSWSHCSNRWGHISSVVVQIPKEWDWKMRTQKFLNFSRCGRRFPSKQALIMNNDNIISRHFSTFLRRLNS